MSPQAALNRKLQILIVGLALLLTLAGQFAFYLSPDTRPWAVGLSLLGVALFLMTARVEAWLQRVLGPATQKVTLKGILIFFAFCLSGLAALLNQEFEQAQRRNYLPVLALVLLAGLSYVWAFAHTRAWPWPNLGVWLRTHSVELSLFVGIVLIGISLRFYALGQLPRVIDGDEGLIGDLALATKAPPFATPSAWPAEVGGFYMQAIRIILEVFGPTPFALRLLPALGGALALVMLYLLGRHLFGVRVALFGTVLLALSHSHIHSRIASVSYIQGTWITPLVLFLFFSGLQRASISRAWMMSATVTALIVGLFNVRVYFFDFVGQCQFGGDERTRFASYSGNYLSAVPRDAPSYLLSTEFLRYGTHISVDFLSQEKPIENWDAPLETLTSSSGALIIAPALRVEELRAWTATHPGGTWQSAYDCGAPMLFAYRVP